MYYLHSMESIFSVVTGESGLFLIINLYLFLYLPCFVEYASAIWKTFHHLLLALSLWRNPSQLLCGKLRTEVLNSHGILFFAEAEACDQIQ